MPPLNRQQASPGRLRRRLGVASVQDRGFILLEAVIAITLITVIMSALGAVFVRSVAATAQQRVRTVAVQVADSATGNLESRDPGGLLYGRDLQSVTTQLATTPATTTPVSTFLAGMAPASDPAAPAGSGPSAAIPTTVTTTQIGSQEYSVSQYLGWCWNVPDMTGYAACTGTSTAGAVRFLRAVVAVTWSRSGCDTTSCTYVTSTLLNSDGDPVYKVGQRPPPLAVIVTGGNQANAVGDSVNVAMSVQTNTGVPAFVWTAVNLPAGLAISPSGAITGSPTSANATAATVTVTVTDGFTRTVSATFAWRIYGPLTIGDPGPQANTTADTVSLTLTASGGTGSPYSWSAVGLPSGLTISSSTGVVSGRPTAQPTMPKQYSTVVTVADNSVTRTTSRTIAWTITYPPLAAGNPGNQVDTVSAPRSLTLSASGGSGSYTWSDANTLPAGLSISGGGVVSGTPTTIGTFPVTLTVNDTVAGQSRTVTFSWQIVALPTVAPTDPRNLTVSGAQSIPVSYVCPNAPCTLALTGAPAGLSLSATTVAAASGTVTVVGTVGSAAVPSGSSKPYAPVVTITDQDAKSGTGTASWTAWAVPTLAVTPTATAPATVQLAPGAAVTGQVTQSNPGQPGTYSVSGGGPASFSVNAGSGAISGGSAPLVRQKLALITLTFTTNDGVIVTKTVTWFVDDLALSVPNRSLSKGSNTSIILAPYVTGGSLGTTFTAQGLPPGLSLTNGVVSGKPNTVGTYTVIFTAQDSVGAIVVSQAVWTVT